LYIPLGIFRLTLATFVLIVHTENVYPIFKNDVSFGGLGVWLFYLVSGFVIFSAHDNFYRGRAKNYLINRLIRIFPTLWFCLLFSLAILYYVRLAGIEVEFIRADLYGTKEFLLSLTVIGGFLNENVWAPLPPGATLTIEMKFYVLSAVIFFTVDKYFKNNGRGLFILAIPFLIAYIVVDLTDSQYRWFGALRYSPVFILGAATYYTKKLGWQNLGASTIFILSAMMTVHFTLVTASSSGYSGWELSQIRITTSMLFFSMFFLLNFLVRIPVEGGIKKIDRFLGDLTYPFYLIQIPLLALILMFFDMSGIVDWIILYSMCLVASMALHFALERPLVALRRKWRGKEI